jgi:hypothetical protein
MFVSGSVKFLPNLWKVLGKELILNFLEIVRAQDA